MELSRNVQGITEHLEIIDDPRTGQNSRHRLIDIIAITICAVIAGNDTWEEVADYAEDQIDWLRQFLPLPHRVPSHDTIRRVFIRLNSDQLEQAFRDWIAQIRPQGER